MSTAEDNSKKSRLVLSTEVYMLWWWCRQFFEISWGSIRFFPDLNLPGLFTSRGCRRCEASGHEAVVLHREWAATKQTSLRGGV